MPKDIPLYEAGLIGGMKEALAQAEGQLTLRTTKLDKPARTILPVSIARMLQIAERRLELLVSA
jgi:hypothetical protein